MGKVPVILMVGVYSNVSGQLGELDHQTQNIGYQAKMSGTNQPIMIP